MENQATGLSWDTLQNKYKTVKTLEAKYAKEFQIIYDEFKCIDTKLSKISSRR